MRIGVNPDYRSGDERSALAVCYNTYIVNGTLADALRLAEGPKRTAAVAAWIQSLYSSRPPVLVGGAAVELYTGGAYTTGDFDFVGEVSESVGQALETAGFRHEGRHWVHAKAELFIEFPGSAIQAHERTAMLELEGVSVLTLSPEDMIIDRLAAWQFWRSTTDGASAFLLWMAQEKRLDRKRLAKLAELREVQRALSRLEEFARRADARATSSEELEKWASRVP